MRTKTVVLRQWDELDSETKKKVLSNLWDLNTMHDWYNDLYEDAKQIGLKITGFDTDHRFKINVEFVESFTTIARRILENHGKESATYFSATAYIGRVHRTKADKVFTVLQKRDELEDAENYFKRELEKAYWNMLVADYNYLTSDEQVIESIKANEYFFDDRGRIQEPDPEKPGRPKRSDYPNLESTANDDSVTTWDYIKDLEAYIDKVN